MEILEILNDSVGYLRIEPSGAPASSQRRTKAASCQQISAQLTREI